MNQAREMSTKIDPKEANETMKAAQLIDRGEFYAGMDVAHVEKRMAEKRELIATTGSTLMKSLYTAEVVAAGMSIVKRHIGVLKNLQGTTTGFVVDREYSEQELVGPLTDALIMGLPFTDNCINIISKRLYVPLNGWEHRYREQPDMTFPDVRIGSVEITEESHFIDLPKEKWYENNGKTVKSRAVPGMSRVEGRASTKITKQNEDGSQTQRLVEVSFRDYSDTPGGMDERIIVRVNAGMGEDAIIGKARRKMYKLLWTAATGQMTNDDEELDEPAKTFTVDPTSSREGPQRPLESGTTTVETVSFEVEPGSVEDCLERVAKCKTVAAVAAVLSEYGFDGQALERVNLGAAKRRAEIRATGDSQA